MNIVCDKVLLSAAIDGVSKAVTMRSAIPVLEGILLKAEGFQLNLTGYDLEMGIVTTIEANVKEAGEVVLNAKLLSSMISRMPAGQVSILSAENGKTTIQSGVVQFEIDAGITLDVEGQLFGISPFAVTPAVLAITHRFLPVYDTYGIVFLPQMLQGLSFTGQSLVDSFLVKIPVEELIRRHTRLFIKQVSDVFIRDICR